MGSVVAGDMILFLRGQIVADQIRERCGHCALRHVMIREGYLGRWQRWLASLEDRLRWCEWQWQKRTWPVLYPPPMELLNATT